MYGNVNAKLNLCHDYQVCHPGIFFQDIPAFSSSEDTFSHEMWRIEKLKLYMKQDQLTISCKVFCCDFL